MRAELEKHFNVLMSGKPKEFKQAKKDIKKLLHGNFKEAKNLAPFVFEYIKKFDQIGNTQNQAAFISGLDLFFLILSDDHFNELKNFIIKTIQNRDGHVREAARNVANWLYISVSDRMDPFVWTQWKELTQKQKDNKQIAKEQCKNYIKEIELLMDVYEDTNDGVEFIYQMKPSIAKSLQLLWDKLTISHKVAELLSEPPKEVADKRREIEKRLANLLSKVKNDFDLDDIKDIIYNESEEDDFTDIIKTFDDGQDLDELNRILGIISDAWNYFPHKSLGGLSPAEKLLEYKK